MKKDVWFTRYEGQLFVAVANHGQEPTRPNRASSVGMVKKWLREKGYEVAQVGILPPEYLGLE
jgi:hypothetical protein